MDRSDSEVVKAELAAAAYILSKEEHQHCRKSYANIEMVAISSHNF